MPDENDDGLASYLYAEADHLEATARTIRAKAVMLRLTHERAESQRTRSTVLHCQPLSLETAMENEPKCDACGKPRVHCMGCHDGAP